MRSVNYNQWLLPYLEGTLDAGQTAEIEARLDVDPRLAAEAERLRQTLNHLQATATRTQSHPNATPPADLWRKTLRARIVLEPAPRRTPPARLWWAAGASLAAASLILVGVVRQPLHHTAESAQTAMPRQIARDTAGPQEAARPQTVRPATPLPQQIASVPKPSAAVVPPPISSMPSQTQSDPFALPKPLMSQKALVAAKPPQFALTVPPAPLKAHAKPPVQIASRTLDAPPAPELGQNYGAVPTLAAPPLPQAAPLVLPAPMAAPPMAADAATQLANPTGGVSPGVSANAGQKSKMAFKAKSQPNDLYQSSGLLNYKPGAAIDDMTPEDKPLATVHEAGMDEWQASLAAAVRPPLWGENAGMQQANQALLSVQMAGRLNEMRGQLEAQRGQASFDVITSRMLAAVDDFGGFARAALEERRHTVTLEGSDGEDWFALAQLEERAGDSTAAKAAYLHALSSPVPPPPFHAAIARQRSR